MKAPKKRNLCRSNLVTRDVLVAKRRAREALRDATPEPEGSVDSFVHKGTDGIWRQGHIDSSSWGEWYVDTLVLSRFTTGHAWARNSPHLHEIEGLENVGKYIRYKRKKV